MEDNHPMCSECGELLNNGNLLCEMCGKKNVPHAAGDVDYIKKMKDLVTGGPFVVGCVLMTLGTIGSAFILPLWLGIIEIVFAAVYIVPLWMMMYEALFSRRRKINKTLLALKMFKIASVLALVMIIVGLAVALAQEVPYMMYGGLIVGMVAAYIFVFVLIVLAGLGLGIFAVVMLYIRPLFKVLTGIERRITLREYAPLRGLGLFTAFSLLGVVAAFVLALVDNQAADGLLFIIFNSVGLLLCLYTLHRY